MNNRGKNNKKRWLALLLVLAPVTIAVALPLTMQRAETAEMVTVNAHGVNGTVEGAGRFRIGDTVTLTFTANENYKFGGWIDLDTEDRTLVSDQNPYTFTVRKAVNLQADGILYGEFTAAIHTPVHVGNGVLADVVTSLGQGTEANSNWIQLLPVTFPHFTFEGWFLTREGTGYGDYPEYAGYTYSNELSAETLATQLELTPNVLHLYAKLTPTVYEVTYVTNGGSFTETVPTKFLEGDPVTLSTAITKANDETLQVKYTFAGWYEEAGFTTQISSIAEISEDITVYARWTETPITQHTVTWMNGDETYYTHNNIVYNDQLDPVTDGDFVNPTKASTDQYDYEFAGWCTDSACETTPITLPVTITEDCTFYAKFTATERTYSIEIKDENGDVITTVSKLYSERPTDDASVVAIIEAASESYEHTPVYDAEGKTKTQFNGWDISLDGENGEITVTPNITEINLATYKVTMHYLGATMSINVLEGFIPAYPTQEIEGKHLVGVYTDAEFTTELTEAAWNGISADMNLYFKYSDEAQEFTLRFTPGFDVDDDQTYVGYTVSKTNNISGRRFASTKPGEAWANLEKVSGSGVDEVYEVNLPVKTNSLKIQFKQSGVQKESAWFDISTQIAVEGELDLVIAGWDGDEFSVKDNNAVPVETIDDEKVEAVMDAYDALVDVSHTLAKSDQEALDAIKTNFEALNNTEKAFINEYYEVEDFNTLLTALQTAIDAIEEEQDDTITSFSYDFVNTVPSFSANTYSGSRTESINEGNYYFSMGQYSKTSPIGLVIGSNATTDTAGKTWGNVDKNILSAITNNEVENDCYSYDGNLYACLVFDFYIKDVNSVQVSFGTDKSGVVSKYLVQQVYGETTWTVAQSVNKDATSINYTSSNIKARFGIVYKFGADGKNNNGRINELHVNPN